MSSHEEENVFEKVHLGNLLPNIIAPCGLYLKFKGKVIPVLKKGTPVNLDFLNRMYSNRIYFALIKSDDKGLWDDWIKKRFPFSQALKWFQVQENKELIKQIASFKSYAFDKIKISSDEVSDYENYLKEQNKIFNRFIKDINLSWYFSKHWTEQSFFLSAKISYILIFFLDFLREKGKVEKDKENEKGVIQFAIVHNPETEKSIMDKEKEHERASLYIKTNKIVVGKELGVFLRENYEFYKNLNNKSFDLSKFTIFYKSFSLIQEFEKNRANIHGGNRKERIEKSLGPLRSHDRMDEELVTLFEDFLKRIVFKI